MWIFAFLFTSLLCAAWGQESSLCPTVLRYAERNAEQPDRIYGTITISTDEDLEGVWLKIFFDRKITALGIFFSDTVWVSKDNTVFNIRNPNYRFSAGPPILIRFYVQYDTTDLPPNIIKINLNGKLICPSQKVMVLQNQTSWHIVGEDHNSSNRDQNKWPYTEPNEDLLPLTGSTDDSDERFQGDFANAQNKRTTSRPLSTPRVNFQCGIVAQRITPLITNAHQETTPGQWPWHAALYLISDTELKYKCGGTLISDQHIITAAHCVTKLRTNQIVPKNQLMFYLGKYNLVRFDKEVQNRGIESITVHPEYNATILYNDIAVIKLESPVEINNFVRPCCLWEDQDTNLENIIGKKGTVVGWGYNEQGQLSQNLMKAEMPIILTSTCLFSNRDVFSVFLSDKNFCAGFKNGTSVCNGDSGGGLVLPRHGSRGENTVWQLRGIVSVGVAKQGQAVCDPKQYSIFTDAAKYVPWIKQTVGIKN